MIVYASNGQPIGDGVRVTRVSGGGQKLEVMVDAKTERYSEVRLVADDPVGEEPPEEEPDEEPPAGWTLIPPADPVDPEFITLDGGSHVFTDRSDIIVTGTASRVTFERCKRFVADKIKVMGTGPETGGNLLAVIDSEDFAIFGCDMSEGTNGVYINSSTRGAIMHNKVDRLGHDGMKFMGARHVLVSYNEGQKNPATLPEAHYDNYQMQGPCEYMEFRGNFSPTGGQGIFSSAGPHKFIRIYDNVMISPGHANQITLSGEGIEAWNNTVIRPYGASNPIARISLEQVGATPNRAWANVRTDKASRGGVSDNLLLQTEYQDKPFYLGNYMPGFPQTGPWLDPHQTAVKLAGFGADLSVF